MICPAAWTERGREAVMTLSLAVHPTACTAGMIT